MILLITGKTGSGKTTVSNMFVRRISKNKANLINADKIGHKLLDKSEIKRLLIKSFGKGTINKTNNKINRKKLGEIVFSDKNKLKRLNNLIHPRLLRIINKKLIKNRINIIDAALYDKVRKAVRPDYVVLVRAKKETIKKRLKGKGWLKRHKYQIMPKKPDFIIDNNKTKKHLRERVEQICALLSQVKKR